MAKDMKDTPVIFPIADPDGMTSDELRSIADNNKRVITPYSEDNTVYDPTQEIVNRLDRIAVALEEQNAMTREEMRAKGYAVPRR